MMTKRRLAACVFLSAGALHQKAPGPPMVDS